MIEQPDDLLDDLVDREENPVSSGARNITDNIKDEAVGRVKDKAAEAGKDIAKKAGKEVAKQGGKTAATAGGEAAAGAGAGAAAGGGAAAAGAGVAATTGVETAGVGVLVGIAIAVLGNKKLRGVAIFSLIMMGLLQILILITVVLTPVIIVTAVVEETIDAIENTTIVRGAKIVVKGVTKVAGAVEDTASAIDSVVPGDGAPCVDPPGPGSFGCGYVGGTENVAGVSTDPTIANGAQSSVLAAQSTPGSRIDKLAVAMTSQGYFTELWNKYGFKVKKASGGKFQIYLDSKVIKTVNSQEALEKELNKNKAVQEMFYRSGQEDLYVPEYSQRITLAEKGLTNYTTAQLFVPGADTAKTPDEVSGVRKKSLETQNNPFLPQMTSDLACTTTSDCGTWVADTVAGDASTLTESISSETKYKTKGTLYSLMKERLASITEDEQRASFWDWYRYVGEIAEASELKEESEIAGNTFIQGALKTRKDQAGREWMHWRTVTDQYKTGGANMTDESASALFANFEGGAKSKAYHYLSGQTGGVGFKDYEKLNDNQKNIVNTIYTNWQEENPAQAKIVTKSLENGLMQSIAGGGFLSGLFGKLFSGNDTTREAFSEAGFELGSQIMIPVCDGSKDGTNFMNCLYAGAEGTARDVGISDYGFNGAITKEDYDLAANYTNGIENKIASQKPLFERLTSLEGSKSFARTFFMRATIPLTSNKGLSSITSYLTALPGNAAQVMVASLNPAAHAAEEKTKINNVNLAGLKLGSLLDTPVSNTLEADGSLNSCPVTQENEENLCRSDETTWLALAAKFGLLDTEEDSFKFVAGSYNILNADTQTAESLQVGGCATTPVALDPKCAKTRATRQAQIITGQTSANPTFDLVGLQEVTATQYRELKTLLPVYQSVPSSASRMDSSKDGTTAIFWNSTKFTKFDSGKAAAISETGAEITQPWVGLQGTTDQKFYVTSVNYPDEAHGGTDAVIKRAARLTMDWVRAKAKDDAIVIILGDFNDELGQKLHYCVYTEDKILQHVHDIEQLDTPLAGCSKPDTEGIDHIYLTPKETVKTYGWTRMSNTGTTALASDRAPVYTAIEVNNAESGGSEFVIGTYNQKRSLSEAEHQTAINNIATKMDVVGTQETSNPKYTRYKEGLATRGFGVYPEHMGPNQTCAGAQAIFYKTDKFNFIKGEWFEVPRYPDGAVDCGGGEKTTGGHNTDGGKLPPVWTHIPIVWLRDAKTQQPVIVINTHNVANVKTAAGTNPAYSRYVASKIYVQQIKRLKTENPGIPIFLTGDFNEGTGVRRTKNITWQGEVESLLFCMFAQNKLMVSVTGPPVKCGGYGIGGVDYIYSTPEVKVEWTKELTTRQAASDHNVPYAKVIVPGSGTKDVLRIATFNILHVGPSDFEKQWRTRMPTSIKTLTDNDITVAGLQEVRPEQHDLLTTQPYSTNVFDIFPKTSKRPGFSPNPIIWNKSLYSLVEGKTLDIEYDSGNKIDHAVQVLLKDKKGNEFYVLNTHDPANVRPGSDAQNALSRLNNAKFYTKHLGALSTQGKPIFLTGDFNSGYTMGGGQAPYNGDADNLTYCVVSRGGVLKNVWDSLEGTPFKCPRSKSPPAPIDHIYSANIKKVEKVWTAPKRTNGSDHPTVMAEIIPPWGQKDDGGSVSTPGTWGLPLARSSWNSDGTRWLAAHNGGDAWTNRIEAAADLNRGSGNTDCGDPVYSMLSGTVVASPPGYTMQIKSNIGGKTVLITYAHGNNMKQSGTVKAGDKIMTMGRVGNPAYSMTCHLHLEISYAGKPVCPQDVIPLVARGQSVALPSLVTQVKPNCR